MYVGILEHPAAIDKLLHGLQDELYVHPSQGAVLLHLYHASFGALPLLGGELARALVVGVALVVVQVSLEFALCLGYAVPLLSVAPALPPVAVVVAAGRRTVVIPVAEANPAKIGLAHFAGDVVAALVFFDARIALWALFGVGEDPVSRLDRKSVV